MPPQKFPKGFAAFIITESLGAFNDNFFKMLVQLYVLVIISVANEKGLIAMASLVFTIPFVIFGPWAGYLADRFAKSRLIQIIKICEIPIMLLGVLAFVLHQVEFLIAILFLMAAQSAFFSPAKAGFVPETCPAQMISRANGILGMTTFFSIIIGTALAGLLLSLFDNRATLVALFCVLFALLGTASAFFVTPTKPSGAHGRFPLNPLAGIFRDLVFLKKQRGLFLASLATSYFWLLGLIFQTNILVYGKEHLGLTIHDNALLSLLPAVMGVGIAIGSLLAGRWSGKKVEIGLVPLGGLGLTLAGIVLFFTTTSYALTVGTLFFAGIFGGLYMIPLNAFLQFEAGALEKGRVIATAGVLNGLFLVLGSILYRIFAVEMALAPATIYLLMGSLTLLVTIYICTIIPEYFVRFLGWLLTHTFYRIKITGTHHVPLEGPALLVPNHVSFVDALLVGATIQRFIKFVMYKKIYEIPLIKHLCKIMEVIPIAPYEGRASVVQSLDTARKQLEAGEVVCIFPEGAITRDGEIKEFKRGMEAIMAGMTCPIIPVYLHNVWGSIFSFAGGKAFWKFPKKIPYPITVAYGEPMSPTSTAEEVKLAVRKLEESAGA